MNAGILQSHSSGGEQGSHRDDEAVVMRVQQSTVEVEQDEDIIDEDDEPQFIIADQHDIEPAAFQTRQVHQIGNIMRIEEVSDQTRSNAEFGLNRSDV